MTHIWLITTAFGENADSHTIRLDHMLANLDRRRFQVTLVTPRCSNAARYAASIRTLDEIVLTDVPVLVRLIENAARVPTIGRRLAWILNNLFYKISLPDKFRGWSKIVLKKFEESSARPDLILSASGSCEAHIAGSKIRRAYGLPWIADLGDPWHFVERAVRPMFAERIKGLEEETLAHCDTIIVTTDSTKEMYEQWLGLTHGTRVCAIPYGFLQENIDQFKPDDKPEKVEFFCHVGTAHSTDRNLVPLIRALALVQRNGRHSAVGLILAGRRSPSFDEEVHKQALNNVQLFQTVTYQESIRLQCISRAIVIVGNRSGAQVPGKVYVALGINKPILYIAQCDESLDEALKVLRTYGSPVVCINDEASIYEALQEILGQRREGFSSRPKRASGYDCFEGVGLARILELEIDRALPKAIRAAGEGDRDDAG